MDSIDFGISSKIYMQNSAGKFWEIRNENQTNHIRTGKIVNGKEEGVETSWKRFNSIDKALLKGKDMITSKRSKGYAFKQAPEIAVADEFLGDYLEKGSEFLKIQVHEERVKTEKGAKGSPPETSIYTYKDHQTAIAKAKEMVRKMLATGYKRNSPKFAFDFNKSDIIKTMSIGSEDGNNNKKEGLFSELEKQCTFEISEDEEETHSLDPPKSQPGFLRRSGAVEIDDHAFPVSQALLLSSMHQHQIVEDEENGILTSFIFEKPEIKEEDLNASQHTEVLVETEEEILEKTDEEVLEKTDEEILEKTDEEIQEDLNGTQILELPVKRKREKVNPYKTIQSMMDSINLGRYVLNFETRGIHPDHVLIMNDNDLQELGIPKKIRQKILGSIQDGEWVPNLTGSAILPYDEEEKVKQRKIEGNDLIRIDQRYVIERGKGKPADKIQVLLAQTWDDSIDPTGWIMSEKLDGVRCYWNGSRLQSRNGNPFFAPKFYIEKLPKTVSLDGELWMGRKQFSECVGIIKRQDAQKYDMNEWAKIVYVLFDAPSLKAPFEDRLNYIHNLAAKLQSPYVRAHEHYRCESKEHMYRELQRVQDLGGEGLMLRKPGSMYEHRRSDTLLKVKTFFDAEATVTGHQKGTGRLANLMGALEVVGDNGVKFKIGSGFTDEQRRRPPKIGSRVTYKYQEVSNKGKPRFPIFLRQHPGF